MTVRRKSILVVLASLVLAAGFAASTVKPASAANAASDFMATIGVKNDNAPAPTCKDPYVFSGKKVGCVPCPSGTIKDTATQKCKVVAVAPAAGGADVEVEDSGIDSFNLNMHGTIVADVHLKGTKKNSPRCGVSDGWNGYKVVSGQWKYRWEKNVQYCPNPNSPTGFAKTGGGDTGKDCENPFKPGHSAPPGPKLVGPITELNSFNVNIPVSANAHASVHGQCPNIDVGGSARASGMVKATITQSLIMKAKGKVSALSVLLQQVLIGQGVAKATANLHLRCNVPPPVTTTTPGTTTTQTVTTTTPTVTTTTTTPVPAPSVTITGFSTINQVPAGQPSNQQTITVNASAAGSLTVNPSWGTVSDCSGGSRQSSLTFSLAAGNNSFCYYYYAPNDAARQPSDTITYTAIVTTAGGTAKDVKSQTLTISYPTRP